MVGNVEPAPRKTSSREPGEVGGRTGRPRDERADQAILEAAEALVVERGPAAVTFDAIARRAGVARATLYLRYKNILQVMRAIEAAAHRRQPAPTDTGDIHRDLSRLVAGSVDPSGAVHARFHAHLISAQAVDEDLAADVRAMWRRRREVTRPLLERAVARGQIRPDANLDVALDMLSGLAYFRTLVRSEELTPDELQDGVDILLQGLSAGPD